MSRAVIYPILVGIVATILLVSAVVTHDPLRALLASGFFFTASWMFSHHRWARR